MGKNFQLQNFIQNLLNNTLKIWGAHIKNNQTFCSKVSSVHNLNFMYSAIWTVGFQVTEDRCQYNISVYY